jgi:adenylate cyclase
VHQLRVEARRVIAVLAVLHSIVPRHAPDRLERRIKDAFRASARLRDTHVRMLLIEKESESFPELRMLGKVLRKREERLVQLFEKCIECVRRAKLGKSIRHLRKSLRRILRNSASEEPGLRALLKEVKRAHRRTVVLLRHARNGSPARIHRVRVAFKKFRYLVEVLKPLIAGLSSRELRQMRNWQDAMGEIQDTDMLRIFIAKREAKKGNGTLDRFLEHLDQRQEHLISEFLVSADQLLEFWPPNRGPFVRKQR